MVWLDKTYKKLVLVSTSTFIAHLSIRRNSVSALENIWFVCSSADSTLLRHAYTTQPYYSTLDTRAFTNCNFTLMLEIPKCLQFALTAKNVDDALFILTCNRASGHLLQFEIFRPKYLNSFTVYT